MAPSQTAAASVNAAPSGISATGAVSARHRNSACTPNRQALTPNTRSPARNRVTAGPAASTSPANSLPKTRRRGRFSPVIRRATGGVPAR